MIVSSKEAHGDTWQLVIGANTSPSDDPRVDMDWSVMKGRSKAQIHSKEAHTSSEDCQHGFGSIFLDLSLIVYK